jgi:predicted Zn-dependent protease
MAGDEADAIRLEREVGQDLARGIRQQLKLDPDPQIAQLLNEVGSRLAGCVANKLRTFSFETLEGGEPNAFALPGGYIFVTRSLLELCERNPDEIAFIFGHEMSHVIRGHAMDRIITNSAISLGTKLTSVRGPLTALLNKVGISFLESAYSQDLEMEADKLGVRLVVAAGYNAKAAAVMLSRLAKLSPPGVESGLGHYFSSHPSINLRIKNIG